jgi:phosphoenolpyruvate synthase/pyruvate phosphate dikinase
VYNRWYEVIKASSGVAFTIDPDTGFQNTIIINGGAWARILSRAHNAG